MLSLVSLYGFDFFVFSYWLNKATLFKIYCEETPKELQLSLPSFYRNFGKYFQFQNKFEAALKALEGKTVGDVWDLIQDFRNQGGKVQSEQRFQSVIHQSISILDYIANKQTKLVAILEKADL